MCHNLAAFGSLKLIRKDLIRDVIMSARFNKDGFALHTDIMHEPLRTLDIRRFTRCLVDSLNNSTAIHFHLRATTSGAVSVENCHLFAVGDTYLSHNGVIPKLAQNPIFSDTNLFAAKLAGSFNAKTIIKAAKKYSAQGCFIFTSKDFERVYVMSIAKTTYIYYLPKISIVSNTEIQLRRYGDVINPAITLNNSLTEFTVEDDSMLVPRKKYNIVVQNPISLYLNKTYIPYIDYELMCDKEAAWRSW